MSNADVEISQESESTFTKIPTLKHGHSLENLTRAYSNGDVQETFALHSKNSFDAPGIRCFWANDGESKDGEFTHHGNKTAREWANSHAPEGKKAVLMSDLESHTPGSPRKLDDYEKSQTDKNVLDAVCAAQSQAYAKSAKDSVLLSVKGAAPASFFRQIELPEILENKAVDKMIIASRDDPKGTEYSKAQGYEALKNQWMDSSVQNYQAAKESKAPDQVGQSDKEQEALKRLAKEIVESERNLAKLTANKEIARGFKPSLEEEAKRTQIGKELCDKDPELMKAVASERRDSSMSFGKALIQVDTEHKAATTIAQKFRETRASKAEPKAPKAAKIFADGMKASLQNRASERSVVTKVRPAAPQKKSNGQGQGI